MGGVRFQSPAAASSIQSAKNFSSSRSPPPAASPIPTSRSNVPSIRNKTLSPPLFRKAEQRPSNWRVEIPVSDSPGEVVDHKNFPKYREQEPKGNVRSRLEARRVLFEGNSEAKGNKLASHDVPFKETAQTEQTMGANIKEDDLNSGHKVGNLSTVRMQLLQIKNQQSNLLELLQVQLLSDAKLLWLGCLLILVNSMWLS